jgi:hypothetical protein
MNKIQTNAEIFRARLEERVLDLLTRLAGSARSTSGGLSGSLLRRLVIETRNSQRASSGTQDARKLRRRRCLGALTLVDARTKRTAEQAQQYSASSREIDLCSAIYEADMRILAGGRAICADFSR